MYRSSTASPQAKHCLYLMGPPLTKSPSSDISRVVIALWAEWPSQSNGPTPWRHGHGFLLRAQLLPFLVIAFIVFAISLSPPVPSHLLIAPSSYKALD